MTPIPFVDLKSQYAAHREQYLRAIEEVIADAAFILGPHVQRFERAFAARIGAAHAVGCSSGTSALSLTFEAYGIGPGDEVVTVPNSFFATVEAILHVGATPVFADVDPDTHGIDPAALDAAVTPRTRAVVPVHLYGNPCDMDAVLAVARRFGIKVVEDAAQAHLATHRGCTVGTLGDAAAFSFYPGKNLGAYGDAGAVTTSDDELAAALRKLRDHGRISKYEHDTVGHNHRMDGIQGAVLSAKLAHLDAWTEARRRIAAVYDARLQGAGFRTVAQTPGAQAVHHLYVTEVSNRAETQAAMAAAGIATGVHYPVPLHLQPALAGLGMGRGSFPVAERLADRVLSLPIYPELTEDQVDRVCASFLAAARP